jgi:hypothetical protein
MHRIAGGILLLLLATPAMQAADDPKEKPATPAEQYRALVKEHSQALQDFFKAYSEASDADKKKLRKEKYPDFGPRFLELAEKNAKDPIAVDALVWVATNNANGDSDRSKSFPKALDALAKDHIQSDKIGQVCERIGYSSEEGPVSAFLAAVLKNSPHREIQAQACLSLGKMPLRRARLIEEIKKDPDTAQQIVDAYGKDYLEGLQKDDVEKLREAGEKYYRQFAESYRTDVPAKRLAQVCSTMSFDNDRASEMLLRTLADKDTRPEVLGPATVFLARLLWRRADEMQGVDGADPRETARLLKESEDLYERAGSKYADIELPQAVTIGKRVKVELFALRNLSPGKVAPDIDAADQDGKKFKLSDYRGKVVLLDFWSEF